MKLPQKYTLPFLHPLFFVAVLSLTLVQCRDFALHAPVDSLNETRTDSNLLKTTSALPGGALYEITLPDEWTDLVIYAHGYVNPQEPLALPDDEIEGQPISAVINQLGFAYATTSYRANGLVGPEAVLDILELVNLFTGLHGIPERIYLVGVSEGALVTTLGIEQHGETLSGGLAACGPVGSFNKQIKYLGDFHVLFNYFFPGLVEGDPSGVPNGTINNWLSDESPLKQQVATAVNNNPEAARDLLKVANVPVRDRSDSDELQTTIFDLLRYNILATNNAIDRLGGQPFDNKKRFYYGTGSFLKDLRLNRKVARFTAAAQAQATIKNQFETSGDLSRPVVMTHTTGDQEVPYWHEPIYRLKAFSTGSSLLHSNIPVVNRYGHCNFELSELLTAFGLLVLKVTLQDLIVPSSVFENETQKREFIELSRKEGLQPVILETGESVQ